MLNKPGENPGFFFVADGGQWEHGFGLLTSALFMVYT